MSTKVPQTQQELEAHLAEHIYFLEASAAAFDEGFTSEAKRLATSLRVLLHDTSNSHSLLGQLGRKDLQFYDTALEIDSENSATQSGLTLALIKPTGLSSHVPILDDSPRGAPRQVDFDRWWNAPVFIDDRRQTLSRKDLALSVADQDGGAHVDPSLNETYARLTRDNSLGWVRVLGTSETPIQEPAQASVRQIAHEVLKSLKPGYVAKERQLPPDSFLVGGVTVKPVPAPSDSVVPKVGRNQPCPCGSGKKYKVCHGQVFESHPTRHRHRVRRN